MWVMRDNGTLDIREVQIAWRDRDRVLITDGLYAGERIVVGNIATPVQGMRLTVGNGNGNGDGHGRKGPASAGAAAGGAE